VEQTQLPGCRPVWVTTPDGPDAAAFRSRIGAVWDLDISRRGFGFRGRPAATHVERNSGIGFIDDAVMAAVRRADPFEPPPPSRVGSDCVARIRGDGGFGPGTCAT
jgi:hypothetical protein